MSARRDEGFELLPFGAGKTIKRNPFSYSLLITQKKRIKWGENFFFISFGEAIREPTSELFESEYSIYSATCYITNAASSLHIVEDVSSRSNSTDCVVEAVAFIPFLDFFLIQISQCETWNIVVMSNRPAAHRRNTFAKNTFIVIEAYVIIPITPNLTKWDECWKKIMRCPSCEFGLYLFFSHAHLQK